MDDLEDLLTPKHPAEAIKKYSREEKEADSFEWQLIAETLRYLKKLARDHPHCPHIAGKKGRLNKCSCLAHLKAPSEEEDSSGLGHTALMCAAASCMVWFVQQDRNMQQSIIMGWLMLSMHAKTPRAGTAQTKRQEAGIFLEHRRRNLTVLTILE